MFINNVRPYVICTSTTVFLDLESPNYFGSLPSQALKFTEYISGMKYVDWFLGGNPKYICAPIPHKSCGPLQTYWVIKKNDSKINVYLGLESRDGGAFSFYRDRAMHFYERDDALMFMGNHMTNKRDFDAIEVSFNL